MHPASISEDIPQLLWPMSVCVCVCVQVKALEASLSSCQEELSRCLQQMEKAKSHFEEQLDAKTIEVEWEGDGVASRGNFPSFPVRPLPSEYPGKERAASSQPRMDVCIGDSCDSRDLLSSQQG